MDFQILGPLRVTDDRQRVITLGGAKPAAVLAMLVLRPNELVPSDRLIEDLWDGQPPPTAAKTLQVHISRLRRALGDSANGGRRGAIVTSGGGYVLEVDPDQIDAQRFQTLVTEGRAALVEGAYGRASARLRSALALWRGDALADFAYASFAQDEIARLGGLRTVAVESAIEAELALGRHTELIPELKSLVKRHPLSERLRAQLMLALYRAGRQAEALGVYRAARRVLVDQLGLEPSTELRELERAILAHDPDLAAPAPQAHSHAERAQQPSRAAMVGYEHELGSLEEALEQALAGRGGLALIAGEPGVGKTRLADELGAVANARGAQVVWGRCASGSGAPAYWAWIQALRALVSDRNALMLRAELGATATEITQLLPELRDVLPDLCPLEHGDAEDVRFKLFDATAGFLVRAAATQPLVIVLDDLHSADQSTRSLLEFLAPAVLDARVLLVATYRDTEAIGDAALSATLTALTRMTDCLQLVLTGLAPDDTAHFVELTARLAPMPVLASAIHDVTSGNPLFVSELIRLLAVEDRLHELERDEPLSLPRGIDQVIARRLEHLSPEARRTLSLAAVIGRDFDSALLARVADLAEDELLGQMEGAIGARIVEPSPGGDRTLRFSHDLIRKALHAGLPAAERCRVHGAIGIELEHLHGTNPRQVLDQLAYHFSEALPTGDAAKAIEYLTLAGERASNLGAGPEAAGYYARAVEVAKLNDAGAELVCELSVRLAEEFVLLDHVSEARAPIEEAQALAILVPDRVRDARLAVAQAHLAHFDPSRYDDDRLVDAIAVFEEIGDHASAARAWWARWTSTFLSSALKNVNWRGAESYEPMLESAKRSGSAALTNEARRHLAALLVTGAAPLSEASARTRSLLEETTDPYTRARMRILLGFLEAKQGRFDEGRALIAEARSVAPARQRADIESYILMYSSRLEFLAGNMHRAEELARAECADLWSQGLVLWLTSELLSLADPLIALGRLDEASVELERAVSITAPNNVDALLRQARTRARLALAHGDVEAAERSACEAIAQAQIADAPDEHAECLLVLAQVLHAADRNEQAHDVATEALRLSEAQEHVVFAQRARALLGASQRAAAR